MKTVAIVIPVHGQLFYTKQLLRSIAAHTLIHETRVVVCIVDNASEDDTHPYLETKWIPGGGSTILRGEDPDLIVRLQEIPDFVCHSTDKDRMYIRLQENVGFGPGINRGAAEVLRIHPDADLLIMNNDMELLPGCLDGLLSMAYDQPNSGKIGIVGGKLTFPDGNVQHAGAFLTPLGWGAHIGAGQNNELHARYDQASEMEYVTGALFYVKGELIVKEGLFDERFAPAYFEEVDYCVRARRHGYQVWYTPEARAIHYENVTGKALHKDLHGVNLISQTNQVRFYLKHDGDIDQYQFTSDRRILINCKIYGFWSFSFVMRNLAKALSRNNVDVAIAPEEYHEPGDMPDFEVKRLIDKPHDYWNRYTMRSCEGDHMYLLPPGLKRIAHTTGESTRISARWRQQLNHVDQVVTNSTFFKRVMETSGVITPITVIPNPVDDTFFDERITPLELPENHLRGFNFLSVFHFGVRKGPEILLSAFIQEFNEDEDVSLMIHSLSFEFVLQQQRTTVKQYIDAIAQGKKHAPIFATTNPVPQPVLAAFYKRYDVFVLPSRAEGFGLPVIEAAAAGLPSIATNYSGITDFLDEEVGWPLEYQLVDIPLQVGLPYFKNYVGGQWAEPRVDHLRQLMRQAFANKDITKAKGAAAKRRAQKYTLQEVGRVAADAIFT